MVSLEIFVWISDTFVNNFGIKNAITKYWIKVVSSDQMNISPSNLFQTMLLPKGFY